MSHSQFHSTKLFILRHAWLNLWDKHMTTGRINQVTTVHLLLCRALRLLLMTWGSRLQTGVHQTSRRGVNCSQSQQFFVSPSRRNKRAWQKLQLDHLVPRSHKFQAQFSLSHKTTRIMAFKENYQQPVNTKKINYVDSSRSGFPSG